MKKKEFEAIGKKLLPDLPGFAVKGPLLFVRPIGHTLRGVYFARSIDPRGFYVQIFLEPLFVPSQQVGFNIGWRLRRASGRSDSWGADDPHLVEELRMGLKREALPFLSRIHSPRDVADAASVVHPIKGPVVQQVITYTSGDPIVQQAIAFALARSGSLDAAKSALNRFIDLAGARGFWSDEIDRARALKSRIINDPAAAQRQLDAWETETIHNLGLDGFR